MTVLHFGDSAARVVSARIAAPIADLATLKSVPANGRAPSQIVLVTADGSLWRYVDASVLTGDDVLVATPSDTPATGRWLRMPGNQKLSLPIAFGTADAAALLTLQAGQQLKMRGLFWNMTADWTGGSSSAIGVSSGKTGFTVKGSLLGGAGGDIAATLAAASSPTIGTIGSRGKDDRIVRETLAVATAAATPTYAIDQLLYAKTIGTGAAGVKAPGINGATPGTGAAAPNAGGTSLVFNAETTGTGTVDCAYLTSAAKAFTTTLWVSGDVIRFDKVTSAFTAGTGFVVVDAIVLANDGA